MPTITVVSASPLRQLARLARRVPCEYRFLLFVESRYTTTTPKSPMQANNRASMLQTVAISAVRRSCWIVASGNLTHRAEVTHKNSRIDLLCHLAKRGGEGCSVAVIRNENALTGEASAENGA